MANDRIYIVCEWCGSYHCVAKYYPSCNVGLDGDALAKFTEEHDGCMVRQSDLSLMPFTLQNEGRMSDRLDERAPVVGMWPSRVRVKHDYRVARAMYRLSALEHEKPKAQITFDDLEGNEEPLSDG